MLCGYAGLLILWLIAQPLPPLQDYMDWVFQGWVGAELLQGSPPVAAHYVPVSYPVPNATSQGLLALLTLAVGPLPAAKVLAGCALAAFAAISWFLARRMEPHRAGVLAFVLFLSFGANSAFWDGYINYQISILVFVGLLLFRDRLSLPSLALWTLVLFFSHAATFAAWVLLVGFEALANKERRARCLSLLPGLLLLGWYALERRTPVADQGAGTPVSTSLLRHLAYKAYTLSKLGPFHNLVDFADQSLKDRAHAFYLAGVGLNLLFAGLLVAALLPGLRRLLRTRPRDPLLWTSGVLALLFLVLPPKSFGVVNLGERLLYPALLLLLLAVRRLPGVPVLAAVGFVGAGFTAFQFLRMPVTQATGALSVTAESSPANTLSYDRYGLYSSRLYQFDEYRVFLERPDLQHLPPIGFDTSLFLDRGLRAGLPPATRAVSPSLPQESTAFGREKVEGRFVPNRDTMQ